MKKQLSILCLLLLLCNCSEKEAIPEIKKPILMSFVGFVGEKFYFTPEVVSNDFTLKTDDPENISWEYLNNKNTICITPLRKGLFTIGLMDSNADTVSLISIAARNFESENIEEVDMHPTQRSEVIVVAKDGTIKQLIENELWEYVKQRKQSLYTFNDVTKEFTMKIPLLEQNYQGTYDWSIDSLILKYKDITEYLGFKIAEGRNCYIIEADRTHEYQILYPDAGITSVQVNRIWYDWDSLPIK